MKIWQLIIITSILILSGCAFAPDVKVPLYDCDTYALVLQDYFNLTGEDAKIHIIEIPDSDYRIIYYLDESLICK